MPTLAWKDSFEFAQPRMDDTHREFVDALAALEASIGATAAASAPALDALVAHTEAHFAQEERWMAELGFESENCHSMQHGSVLQLLREVQRRQTESHDPEMLTRLVEALAEWFPAHAQMMDAALAETMTHFGFDPETGRMARQRPAEAAPISGCGSASCS
jgi:hemerythrin-like metal-binding protein